MRLLYKNPDNQTLCITGVDHTLFVPGDDVLIFFGDDDICIQVDARTADKLTRSLYLEDRLDITSYTAGRCEIEMDDEDDEDDDEDDDDVFGFDPSGYLLDN